MTDQPTTPTVDTDELRELLDRIETVSIAFTPAGEKGDEWTPSEPHREHRYDGRCAVCRFADYPEARAQVLTAALARPVPAAPAEPGATEVDDLIQKLRAASVHPEAFESALYADAADALAALAAPPAPADEERTLRWTAEGRSHGTMRDGSPNPEWLVTFRDGGRSRGFITGMPRDAAESLVAQLAAALAAPPAPADEGRCRCGCTKAQHVGQSGRLGDPCRFCNTSGQGCPVGYLLAAPPASAVPEERDEARPPLPTGLAWRSCRQCGQPHGLQYVGACLACGNALAARPAPVTAATTEEEAP